MATPNITIPANIEDYTISASLNAGMLLNFLMGVYTMVYGGTLYIYLSKKPSNTSRRVALTAISALYILAFLNFIFQWYYLDASFIVNGQTRDSIFWAVLGPIWLRVIFGFLADFSLVISDGLLIWRCYHVWGRSMKVIAIPSLLFVAELALSITDIVFHGLIPNFASTASAALENDIATALIFTSLGTTVSATFLIGYRIHTASENVGRSRTRYNRIVATIVESSAVYSLVLLLFSMTSVIPLFYKLGSPMAEGQYYIGATLYVVSGLAPTVMVLRLALASPTNTVSSGTITHISGMNLDNSQQGSGGSSGAHASGEEASPSANVENDEQDQTPMIELTKEYTTRDWIGERPV